MPSDLVVPFSGSRALLQVHSPEDCIFAVFLLNVQHGFLPSFFLLQLLIFLFFFLFSGFLIGKQIQLFIAVLLSSL